VIGTSSLANTLLAVPWLIGATAVTWLCLVYARFIGRRLLGSHIGAAPPKWQRRWFTLASSGLLLMSYLPLLVSRVMITLLSLDTTDLVSSGLGWIAGQGG